MDVSETLEQTPHSPSEKDEEEDDHQPSDDEILKGSSSEQDGEEGQGACLGKGADRVTRTLSHGEEEGLPSEEEEHLSTKSPDSDRNDQSQPLKSSLRVEQEEEGANDLGDEASSVIRELDEHELDYDEEVPEEPSTVPADDEADKAVGEEEEEEEEKGDEPPGDEKQPTPKSNNEKDGQEPPKEKKKEEDGEIDDGEIDVSSSPFCSLGIVPRTKGVPGRKQVPTTLCNTERSIKGCFLTLQ